MHQALEPTKIPNHTMPPGIPDSSPFRPRFAHVSPTFRNGSFFCFRFLRWLGPWHKFLEFTALGMEFKDLRQFLAFFRTFGAQNFTAAWTSGSLSTAGFLSRAGAETPLNFREKFRVFPRTILENFSGVDTQTAVLVSTAEVWISAPDTQTPIFLGFLGIHS